MGLRYAAGASYIVIKEKAIKTNTQSVVDVSLSYQLSVINIGPCVFSLRSKIMT